jgi:hypothetical protein
VGDSRSPPGSSSGMRSAGRGAGEVDHRDRRVEQDRGEATGGRVHHLARRHRLGAEHLAARAAGGQIDHRELVGVAGRGRAGGGRGARIVEEDRKPPIGRGLDPIVRAGQLDPPGGAGSVDALEHRRPAAAADHHHLGVGLGDGADVLHERDRPHRAAGGLDEEQAVGAPVHVGHVRRERDGPHQLGRVSEALVGFPAPTHRDEHKAQRDDTTSHSIPAFKW